MQCCGAGTRRSGEGVSQVDPIVQQMTIADDAVSAAAGLAAAERSVAAPRVYDTVGAAKTMLWSLADLLDVLSRALPESIQTHDVYDGRGDSAENAAIAAKKLAASAQAVRLAADHLEAAQTTINQQGYRSR